MTELVQNQTSSKSEDKQNSAIGQMNEGSKKLNYDFSVESEIGFLHSIMSAKAIVSGYYLNLKTGRYYAISQEKTYNERYNSEGDWSRMDDYIRECIHPDDQALITEASRIDVIRERLKTEQDYYVDVRDLGSGKERWYRFTVVRCMDEDHAAFYFKDITDETLTIMRLEQLNVDHEAIKNRLDKALGIANALSYSFTNIYLVDKQSRTLEVVKLDGYITKGLDKAQTGPYPYDTLVESYIKYRVYERDKAFVTKALSWDNMIDHVSKNDEYSFTYKITDNGEQHEYQGRFRNIDEQYIVCGFQNIDDTISKEKEYNDIMSDAGFGIWHIYLKDGVQPRMQANTKMAELLGIDASGMTEEEIYDAWYGRITPGAIPSVQKSVGEMMEGRFSENTYLWTHPTKGDIYVRCGGTCVKLPDGTNMLRGYHADMTEVVKEKENQRRALELKNEEITALNEELREASERQQDQLRIVQALCNDYHNVFLINVNTGTSTAIEITSGTSKRIGGIPANVKHSYEEGTRKYLNSGRIHPDDLATMTRNVDLEYVKQMLQDANSFAGEFRAMEGKAVHYFKFKFSRVEGTDFILLGFVNVDNMVAEEKKRNKELQEMNTLLEEQQAQLEESTAEQEAQIEEITSLNQELKDEQRKTEEEREKAAEAYGMIYGLSREFHTIWIVNKETSRMRLVRSSGVSTIQNAVQMGRDYPEFDKGFDQYIDTYVMPEDRGRMHREIAFAEILRRLEKGDGYSVNYLRKDDSGHVGYHQIAFANADTEDGTKQFVYGFRDIDKLIKEEQAQKEELRKAKEDAEAANVAKTSFLFNMSHDIRTPMNAIMGFRDLLEKHQEDPQRRQDYLKKIEDSSKILLSIINNVLEMARIEKGTLEIDESAWSAEQFNDTLFSVFHDMMKQKNLKFTRQINVEHNYVYCDPIKLREVFINLLSNAYKYTNAGGSVSMNLDEVPCDREGWVLYRTTISDTGMGMSEEFLPHIFDEFSRESSSTETKIEGTGLGMPIVKRLVEMLDGTIEVKSKKGVGSSFIVTIPHRLADKTNLVDHAGVEIDPKIFEGKRILLAEDNDLNAEIAMEILGEAGFLIERAEDGADCCKKLCQSPADYYDVILMDVQMPRMNGYDATRSIRTMQDTAKSRIPIIAMTANAFEEDKREALRSGMNGHIAKPINVAELMKQLSFALN